MPRRVLPAVLLIAIAALLFAAGCASPSAPRSDQGEGASVPTTPAPTGVMLGEQIYNTGIGSNRQPILVSAPKAVQAMVDKGGGCATCHAVNGHGAKVTAADKTVINRSNITYKTLTSRGFTPATIRGAILYCTDENSQRLDETMPCYQMTDPDVEATIEYLKTLK